MTPLKLTLMMDDLFGAEIGFQSGYGFSMLIESGDNKILFDAGDCPDELIHNLHHYGIDAKMLSAVILSHNHYDHVNGLFPLLSENPELPVIVYEEWDKFQTFKGKNIPKQNKRYNKGNNHLSDLIQSLYLTRSFHTFFAGSIYEHALFLCTSENNVLITGCCHPGLNKFLNVMGNLGIKEEKPLTIIGGFHGFKFDRRTADEINKNLVDIYPCHCTRHLDCYKKQFGNKYHELKVGETKIID